MERRGIVGTASVYYDLACCLCSAGRCEEALLQVGSLCCSVFWCLIVLILKDAFIPGIYLPEIHCWLISWKFRCSLGEHNIFKIKVNKKLSYLQILIAEIELVILWLNSLGNVVSFSMHCLYNKKLIPKERRKMRDVMKMEPFECWGEKKLRRWRWNLGIKSLYMWII